MHHAFGFVLIVGWVIANAPAHAQVPKKTEREILLEAAEKQFGIAAGRAESCIACIIVSRSELYPKIANPGDVPGKLGEFDRAEFLKNDSSPERTKLANWLDLTVLKKSIPDHGYVGGVVIDSSGLVLTPYHAIEGATKLYVFLCGKNGSTIESYADIYAADARSDLAVLKLIHPQAQLKAIAMAEVRIAGQGNRNATMFQGKMVGLVAFSYTSGFALDRPSISFGGITNIRYRLTPPNRETPISDSYYKFGLLLEHDVKLNAAVQGGVLINLDGEMVGLTTSTAVVYTKELGPGYAIPIDENVRRVIDVLRKGEEVEYGFLGIELETGVNVIRIQKILPNGPAEIAGLRQGDLISRIDDFPVEKYEDLLLYAGSIPAGTKVKLTFSRNRQEKVISLTLGKFRHTQPFIASVRPDPVFGLRVDHLSMVVQPNKVPPDGFEGNAIMLMGVCVRDIALNSPAANKFKTLGDDPNRWIITHVNGTPIANPTEFYTTAKGQPMVKLTLRDWSEAKPRELILP